MTPVAAQSATAVELAVTVPMVTVQVPNTILPIVVPPPKLASVEDALAITAGTPARPMLMEVAVVVPIFSAPLPAVSKP